MKIFDFQAEFDSGTFKKDAGLNESATAQANENFVYESKGCSRVRTTEMLTWNPITGCTKVSAGCENCPSEVMAKRYQTMGHKRYGNGFNLTMHDEAFRDRQDFEGRHISNSCSPSDWFNENVPYEFLDKIMDSINSYSDLRYQIITKRAERMAEYFATRPIPKNAWLGVAIENQDVKGRIDVLREINAPVRLLSLVPLLEDLGNLDLNGIDWVIVGGESGNKARPMNPQWVMNIQKQCAEQKIPFFFEQWGAWGEDGIKRSTKLNGKKLNGKIYQEMPYWY